VMGTVVEGALSSVAVSTSDSPTKIDCAEAVRLNRLMVEVGAPPGTSRTCIELNGSAVIESVELTNCGGDGIFLGNGATGNYDVTIRDVHMHGISSQLSSGDGV